jgi:hypothetical protein
MESAVMHEAAEEVESAAHVNAVSATEHARSVDDDGEEEVG